MHITDAGTNHNPERSLHTDLASVPPKLHSVMDDDSPIMLYPSAPHDFLFEVRKPHGTRGWLRPDKQLTLTEVNHVLAEAIQICGAGALVRDLVSPPSNSQTNLYEISLGTEA